MLNDLRDSCLVLNIGKRGPPKFFFKFLDFSVKIDTLYNHKSYTLISTRGAGRGDAKGTIAPIEF